MSANFDFSVQYKVTDSGVGEVKGKGKGEGGWLMAFAEAMGKLMEKQVEKIQKFADSIGDKPSPSDSTKLTAMTQMFQMFMNAVSTALKSMGQGATANPRNH
jgi:hypothetical protein